MNLKKKKINNIILQILILVFIKTPFIKILKKRYENILFNKSKSKFWILLDWLFVNEYLLKLKDKNEIRMLTDSILANGKGKKWAEIYYNEYDGSLKELKKSKTGSISTYEAKPIYNNIINFINSNNLSKDKNTNIIQIGSSSGRNLEFFLKIFPDLNYISTDIINEIIEFQKTKYNYPNFKYFKCYAEDIDKCIDYFNLSQKRIIIFSIGSLQYINPFYLDIFFLKIKNYKTIDLFISESVSLKFMDQTELLSKSLGKAKYSHRYDIYAKNYNLKIISKQIIKPYLKTDKKHHDTGHFDLHISS